MTKSARQARVAQRRSRPVVTGLAALAIGLACGPGERPPAPSHTVASASPADHAGDAWFRESNAIGLDFVHFNGMSGARYLAEITCAGGALFDADGDGDLDVFLAQGRMLGPGRTVEDAPVAPNPPGPLVDRLYRNEIANAGGLETGLRFTDVTGEGLALPAGSQDDGYGCGAATGDFDNDGRVDLLVLNLGANRLLRNLGPDQDGVPRFDDVTEPAGVAGGAADSSVAASFYDFDGDGWLDLFVANNVSFVYDDPPPCFDLVGGPDYCGPGAFAPQADRLYRNLGLGTDGTVHFEDVTVSLGLRDAVGPALGVVAADFDGDDRLDLYVANDGQPNRLWVNRLEKGIVRFEDRALLGGAAVNASGASEASMGVDAGDFDGDGDFDLFLAHLVKETNTLYRNDGHGNFEDHTLASGVGAGSLPFTSFGAGFVDVDRDGWLDLFVANGAVTKIPALDRVGDPFPLHQTNQLFRNLGRDPAGTVRFVDATAACGPGCARSEVSRGAAFGDVDLDGDTDVLVINNHGPARLLLGEAPASAHWVGLRLVVAHGRGDAWRDALGAKVTAHAPEGRTWTRRAHSDGSFNVANDPRVLIGLGPEAVGSVWLEVVWPGGDRERFDDVAIDRYTTLKKGHGVAVDREVGP